MTVYNRLYSIRDRFAWALPQCKNRLWWYINSKDMNMRRASDRLIFIIGIFILLLRHIFIKPAPGNEMREDVTHVTPALAHLEIQIEPGSLEFVTIKADDDWMNITNNPCNVSSTIEWEEYQIPRTYLFVLIFVYKAFINDIDILFSNMCEVAEFRDR